MTEISALTRTPETIAAEINGIKEQVRSTVLSAAVEIGKRLTEAKRLVPAGRWTEWLETNISYSVRTAQNMMALADEYGSSQAQALADLSYTKAVLLLGVPRDERAEFAESHDVEGMSTRELQAEIKKLQEEKAALQVTMDELTAAAGGDVADEILAENEKLKKDLTDAKNGIATAKDVEKERLAEIRKLKADVKEKDAKLLEAEGRAQQIKADAETERKKLEQALQDAKQPVIQQVTPPDVERELAELRAKLTRTEEEQALRVVFEQLKSSYEQLGDRLRDLARKGPDLADRFRAAFARGLQLMADRMKEGGGA